MNAQTKRISLRAAASASIVAAFVTGCLDAGQTSDTDVSDDTDGSNTEPDLKAIEVKVNYDGSCAQWQKDKVTTGYRRAVNAFTNMYTIKATATNFEQTAFYGYFNECFGSGASRATVQSAIESLYQVFAGKNLQLKCGCSAPVNAAGAAATAPVTTAGGTIALCPPFFSTSDENRAAALIHEVAHAYMGFRHSNETTTVRSADKYQCYALRAVNSSPWGTTFW